MAAKCRCPICGRKNGTRKNPGRGRYIKHGIIRDERDRSMDGLSKAQERRLLRVREGRAWRQEWAA